MKITIEQLRQIINEEVEQLKENPQDRETTRRFGSTARRGLPAQTADSDEEGLNSRRDLATQVRDMILAKQGISTSELNGLLAAIDTVVNLWDQKDLASKNVEDIESAINTAAAKMGIAAVK